MSKEASEERAFEGIWNEVEGLVGEGDYEAAQEIIDDAEEAGYDVDELQEYLDEQKNKHF